MTKKKSQIIRLIEYCRKLRDEYDKLEGALRKLGVDPDTIVGNHNTTTTSEEDSSEVLDPDLCTPFNVVAVPANPANLADEDGESLAMSRTVNARLRHLDILEEVRNFSCSIVVVMSKKVLKTVSLTKFSFSVVWSRISSARFVFNGS